jgi:hypothetical protein
MTDKYSQEEFEHHLKYEIDMLNYSYEMIPEIRGYLRNAGASEDNQNAAENAMIECFCIHARVLIELFTKPKHNIAKHFCNSYTVANIPSKKPDFNQLLNNQITHIVYGRPVHQPKIENKKIFEILNWLRDQVSRFKNRCKTENIQIEIPDIVTHQQAYNGQAFATNHITSTLSKTNAQSDLDFTSKICTINTHPRATWAEDAKLIVKNGDYELVLAKLANADDIKST